MSDSMPGTPAEEGYVTLHSPKGTVRRFQCEYCAEVFSPGEEADLDEHMKGHMIEDAERAVSRIDINDLLRMSDGRREMKRPRS